MCIWYKNHDNEFQVKQTEFSTDKLENFEITFRSLKIVEENIEENIENINNHQQLLRKKFLAMYTGGYKNENFLYFTSKFS